MMRSSLNRSYFLAGLRRLCLVAPLLSCLAFAGCKQLTEAPKEGEALDAVFHAAVAKQDWKGIYANADPGFRNSANEDKLDALLSAVNKKLGDPVSSTQTGWKINATTSGTYLYSECETKYSKNATATEDFTWLKSDGKYRLYHYKINSDDLISR